MKNYAERKLAVRVMKKVLGFAPPMTKIIPLESSGSSDVIRYVMFQVEGGGNIVYRASDDLGIKFVYYTLNIENKTKKQNDYFNITIQRL